MSQQINLFTPIFLKQQKHFSAVTMAQALGLILLGAVIMIAYINHRLGTLGKEAAATTAQLVSAQADLTRVKAEFSPQKNSKALEEDIQKAETEVKSLQQVFDSLQKDEFGNKKGYSEYMRAFARQIVDGLWLTGFTVYGSGNEIGLDGRTLQPDLVPGYVNRLKREPVMQGKSFATLEMQAPQKPAGKGNASGGKSTVSAGYIEFSLKSSGIKEKQVVAGEQSK